MMNSLFSRPRNLLLLFTSLLALSFFLCSSINLNIFRPDNGHKTETTQQHHNNILHRRRQLHEKIARSHCEGTLYPELCVSTVASFPALASKSLPQVIAATINVTVGEVKAAESNCSSIERGWAKRLGPLERRALEDCEQLFQETMDEFSIVLSDLSAGTASASNHIHDLQTFLSGKS